MNTLENVISHLIKLGYHVTYTKELDGLKVSRKLTMYIRVSDLLDGQKIITDYSNNDIEHMRFNIINELWEVEKLEKPQALQLLETIEKLDVK